MALTPEQEAARSKAATRGGIVALAFVVVVSGISLVHGFQSGVQNINAQSTASPTGAPTDSSDTQQSTSQAQPVSANTAPVGDGHEGRQQIVDDFTTVYKINTVVQVEEQAYEAAQADDATTAYSDYKQCADSAESLANDEQDSLPAYLGERDSDSILFTPQSVTLDINRMCEDGAKYANDPSPEHADTLQKDVSDGAGKFAFLVVSYEHAYVSAGGKASDWAQQFPELPSE